MKTRRAGTVILALIAIVAMVLLKQQNDTINEGFETSDWDIAIYVVVAVFVTAFFVFMWRIRLFSD